MFVILPPLRSRAGDASLLAHHFVEALNVRYAQTPKTVGAGLEMWLESQSWPGNVRELENFIHRRYLLNERTELQAPDGVQCTTDLRDVAEVSEGSLDYRSAKANALADFDRKFLRGLLKSTDGNVSVAAKVACKERRALGKLIRKYGLRPESFKQREPSRVA
jgi:DNA-binding NtrC family response regulator